MQDLDDIPSNPRPAAGAATISEIIEKRLSRRGFLGGMAAVSGLALSGCALNTFRSENGAAPAFGFEEIARGSDPTHHVPLGYQADIVIRWGDALFEDSPAFDPQCQSETAQLRQFGFNNDYVGFIPLPDDLEGTRGLLCVNHEYVSSEMMQPGISERGRDQMTREECLTEMAAHGGTIVEIRQTPDGWQPVIGSPYNRRITAHATPLEISGPAAGSPRLVTAEDPEGRTVSGTVNNCAGGTTPWGTYLMAEENFNNIFLGELPDGHPETVNHERYGVPSSRYVWGQHFDRYNVALEPNEPNRFGWIVEVDPLDPESIPKKRTALGRFKHEGAESVVAPDGRVVLYSGDDQRFDYVYKFVTARRFNPDDRSANLDLLDEGTLFVARFEDSGDVNWMPLTFGEGPLTSGNGFSSQADVLIEARRAADLLGATPMDRPEDVEPDARSGKVWVMLTNNSRRSEEQVDAANPRAENRFGHVIEITEPDGDFTSTRSRWDILVRCGDPENPEFGATWNPLTSPDGWFGSPDNCAVDPQGRLWIATDGNEWTGNATDGLWAMETTGERRGTGRAFFRAPVGAEVCGPKFTPDGETLFLAIQHPGDGRGASFEAPATRWPDFRDDMPARSSIVAIRKQGGGVVGS
ncbi:PhoX family protein [Hyphobacterium sp.]|uniref:PhoX family protein n=1 Tax=Hyphobacterium sp. TaxID=2004662 RepID=UPI003BAAF577